MSIDYRYLGVRCIRNQPVETIFFNNVQDARNWLRQDREENKELKKKSYKFILPVDKLSIS